MRVIVRILLVGGGLAMLVLAVGFFTRMDWAINTWPWPDGRLSYMFVASIQAAIAAGMIWIGLSREFGALAAGSLNLVVMMVGFSVYFLASANQPDRSHLLWYGIACSVFAVVNLVLFMVIHRIPLRDPVPIPGLVRAAYAAFALVLLLVGLGLVFRTEGIMPWPLNPDSSVIFGWIFLGNAFYFLYAFLRPVREYARAQLWSFFAYDVVLIAPLVGHLGTVDAQLMTSLVVYILVLVLSGLLAIYYLFFARRMRVWGG